jgi:hypothetical protein
MVPRMGGHEVELCCVTNTQCFINKSLHGEKMGYQFTMKMIGKKDLKSTTFEGKEIYNNHSYEVVTVHSKQLVHNHPLCMNPLFVIIEEVLNLFEGMDVIRMKNNCNSIVHKILISKRHC